MTPWIQELYLRIIRDHERPKDIYVCADSEYFIFATEGEGFNPNNIIIPLQDYLSNPSYLGNRRFNRTRWPHEQWHIGNRLAYAAGQII